MSKTMEAQVWEQLKFQYPNMKILRNIRPDWLMGNKKSRLELDFFMPDIQVAIEVQGSQHYTYPSIYKSITDFHRQLERDALKLELCYRHGVQLFEVYQIQDLVEIFGFIDSAVQS